MTPLDAYVGNAGEFPVLDRWTYMNHAGVSPWPARTRRAVVAHAEQFGLDAFMSHNAEADLADCRALLATLVNAGPDEVAVVKNTSDAISMIASGLDWRPGDRIVVPAAEYPSNLYPWMDARDRHGCELVQVPEVTMPDGTVRTREEDLIAACDHHRTRLLAVSHVQWASGQRLDVDQLGAWCADKGVLFAVDGIQSLGVVPTDVKRSRIDFLMSGGHKWLLAPPGAGLLYCKRELVERVNPPVVGWLSTVNPWRWEEIDFTRRTEAGRFETGTQAYLPIVGLRESLRLLLEVGVDAVNARLRTLGDRLAAGLAERGCAVVTPRDGPAGVGGAVCFTTPRAASDALVKRLREHHRIELAARAGRVRVAPHFYNTEQQVDAVLAAVGEV